MLRAWGIIWEKQNRGADLRQREHILLTHAQFALCLYPSDGSTDPFSLLYIFPLYFVPLAERAACGEV